MQTKIPILVSAHDGEQMLHVESVLKNVNGCLHELSLFYHRVCRVCLHSYICVVIYFSCIAKPEFLF